MLLQLAGWSGLTDRLKGDPVSRAILKKKGAGIALSAIAGPAGTGFGVWMMTGSKAAAAFSAAAVFVLVMEPDRNYVFASEIQSKVKWTGLFRVPLVLLLGFLTAIAAFAYMNLANLKATAADIQIERATQRQSSFDDATGLGAARVADQSATSRLGELRQQRLKLPADIVARKSAAAACAAGVDRRYTTLLQRGVSRTNALAAVASTRRQCARQIDLAVAAEKTYFADIDADIDRERNVAEDAARAMQQAAKAKSSMIEQANAVDAAGIEPTSLTVIKRYLQDNKLALIELIVIYIIVVVCDGAGLLVASFLGRSPAGWRFERDRLRETSLHIADIVNAHQQIVQAEGLMRQATKAAEADDVLEHIRNEMADAQRIMATANARAQRRAAPFHAASASIGAMVAASLEAEGEARRAHEVNPELGRMADSIIRRAANEATLEMAA